MMFSVELVDSMGNDLSIVNAARVSFHRASVWAHPPSGEVRAVRCTACAMIYLPLHLTDSPLCPMSGFIDHCTFQDILLRDTDAEKNIGKLDDRDAGLINFLMRNKHGTPFEMVQFQFRVRCPIGVAREWFRHRIGSFNEESTRYVEMRPDFYVPALEHMRTQVGKPGSYTYEPMDEKDAAYLRDVIEKTYTMTYDAYKHLMARGLAKEVARNVLPLGLLTEFMWSVNLRSALNFLNLRTAPNALLEIRYAALEVEKLISRVVPVATHAWYENNKVAP